MNEPRGDKHDRDVVVDPWNASEIVRQSEPALTDDTEVHAWTLREEVVRRSEPATPEPAAPEIAIAVYIEGEDADIFLGVRRHIEEIASHLGYGHPIGVVGDVS